MRIKIVAGVVALTLLVGYFAPIVVKLREIPLMIVVFGGIVLVAVDFWRSLDDRNG